MNSKDRAILQHPNSRGTNNPNAPYQESQASLFPFPFPFPTLPCQSDEEQVLKGMSLTDKHIELLAHAKCMLSRKS